MSQERLSVDMKASLGLVASWMIFLVGGGVLSLLNGSFDIYILASFIFLVPYGAFFWFGWKRKKWAYLAGAALSVVLVVVTPAAVTPDITPLLMYETVFSTILLILIALEGFKAYLEFGKGPG